MGFARSVKLRDRLRRRALSRLRRVSRRLTWRPCPRKHRSAFGSRSPVHECEAMRRRKPHLRGDPISAVDVQCEGGKRVRPFRSEPRLFSLSKGSASSMSSAGLARAPSTPCKGLARLRHSSGRSDRRASDDETPGHRRPRRRRSGRGGRGGRSCSFPRLSGADVPVRRHDAATTSLLVGAEGRYRRPS